MTLVPRCIAIVLCLLAAACGGSPTSSSDIKTPNYAGNWHGTYTVSGCTQSGGVALANVCQLVGQNPPYTLTLTQSQKNVTGTFTLGTTTFPSTGGTVAADGSL